MAVTVIPPRGLDTDKDQEMREKVRRIRESALRRYENGYEAYLIDEHPHGRIYRDPHNPSAIVAFPEESIMLLTSTWSVVMFLNNIDDLNRIESEMNLRRII